MRNPDVTVEYVNKKVKVIQKEKEEVPVEILAKSIQEISDGVRKIRQSRLNERALVVLLKDATNLSKTDILKVMNSLETLDRMYLKPVKA